MSIKGIMTQQCAFHISQLAIFYMKFFDNPGGVLIFVVDL